MRDVNRRPEIIVFAGPNGSGKSTITQTLRPAEIDYINADEIQRALHCDNLEAAKTAERLREEHLEQSKDFCFETVLSTRRNLELLQRARKKGFFIRCFYVLTIDPLINVARVRSRVFSGGHGVPENKIIERYDRALNLVPELVSVCDVCHIYDNSTKRPFRIFKKRKDAYFYCSLSGFWLKEDIASLTGISRIESASLNVRQF